MRMIAGLIVTPVAATLIALVTYDGFWHAGLFPDGAPLHSVDAQASLGSGVAILALVMTPLAVPALAWLKARGPLSLGRVLVLGAALGNVPFAAIVVGILAANVLSGTFSPDVARYWYGFSGALVRVALGVISGAGSAGAFWLVALSGVNEHPTVTRSEPEA